MIKIRAEPIKGRDLQPGDLFSTHGPSYWDGAMDKGSVGERVYIRTNSPASDAPDAEDTVYRITVER
jgi:hypothetical protein